MAENHHSGAVRAAIVLVALCSAFYWKLVWTDQYTWLESPDLAHQVLPWLTAQAAEWRSGSPPAWAPYEWAGQPLIGQGQPGVVSPINWLLFAFRLDHGWLRMAVLHWYFVLVHALAAWLMWRLCREQGASFSGALAGAVTFAWGGYCGMVDWPQMLNGAIWAPAVFLFHLRAVRGVDPVRNGVLSGFFLGLSWLSGHHQAPLFVSLAVGISWVFFLRGNLRLWRPILAFGGVFLLTAGAQILPAAEYLALARRWAGLAEPLASNQKVPYHIHELYSLGPKGLLGLVIAGVGENTIPFVGVTALAFAWLGRSQMGYWIALAAGGILFSLAKFGGLGGLFYALVPMVDKARSPSMAVIVTALGLGPLVAMGFDRLRGTSAAESGQLRRVLLWGGVALVAFYFGLQAVRGDMGDQRGLMAGFIALAMAWLLGEAFAFGWSARAAVIGLLLFAELGLHATFSYTNRFQEGATSYLKPMASHADIVEFLRREPEPVRVALDEEKIKYNFGDFYGVDVWGGYLASLTQNILDLDFATERVRQMAAVTHWIGAKPLHEGQALEFRSQSGLGVYRMRDPAPRVALVHRAFRADSKADADRIIHNASFDFSQGAIVGRDLPLENCEGGQAAMLRRSANRVTVAVEAPCRSLLVLAETNYPGWEAKVSGAAAEVERVNVAMRGVVVGKGWHIVEFRYRPRAAMAGAAMSILGALIAFLVTIMRRRRSET